jgi:hypothetical protein
VPVESQNVQVIGLLPSGASLYFLVGSTQADFNDVERYIAIRKAADRVGKLDGGAFYCIHPLVLPSK